MTWLGLAVVLVIWLLCRMLGFNRLDEDLDDLETKHKVIEKEKIDEITGLKRQIDEMS